MEGWAWVAGAGIIVGSWLGIRFSRVRRHLRNIRDYIDLHTVELYLKNLTNSQHPQAFLTFADATSKGWKRAERYVQFTRSDASGEQVLACLFPKDPWSEPYLGQLKAVIQSRGRPFGEPLPGEHAAGYVVIDRLRVQDAVELLNAIFREVFECPTVRVRVFGRGVSGIDLRQRPTVSPEPS